MRCLSKKHSWLIITILLIFFLVLPFSLHFIAILIDNDIEIFIRVIAFTLEENFTLSLAIILPLYYFSKRNFKKIEKQLLIIAFITSIVFTLVHTPMSIRDFTDYISHGPTMIADTITKKSEGGKTPIFYYTLANSTYKLKASFGPNMAVGQKYMIYYLPYSKNILWIEPINN